MRDKDHKRKTCRGAGLLVVTLVLAVTACAENGGGSSTGRSAATCPDAPLATLLAKDVSGTQKSPDLDAQALAVVEAEVEQAVSCAAQNGRGHVALWLFATNTAQTATVLSRDLQVTGATAIARERKAEREHLAEDLMAEIRAAYEPTRANLPAEASDVLSQFPIAVEQVEQLASQSGQPWALNFTVLTDGLASRPDQLDDGQLTSAKAQELAASLDPPWDNGFQAWSVAIVGVGRVAGDHQPSTETIEALKVFYRAWLKDSAERVLVVTDYPVGSVNSPTSAGTTRPEALTGAERPAESPVPVVAPSDQPDPSNPPDSPSEPGPALEVTGMKAIDR